MDEEIITQEQGKNNDKRIANLLPYQYKKGQSGNPGGRPKGISLKEYARNKMLTMTEEEREEFLHGLNKLDVWKQAEGNPENQTDITSNGEGLAPILVKFINAKDDTNTTGVQKTI